MAKESLGDDEKSFHKSAKDAHDAAAAMHDGMCEECSKATESDLNKLVPTNVSTIAPDRPTVRPVLRYGSPAIPVGVAVDFTRIIGSDEESMDSPELSLRK
jgi:hypothetical protein